MIEPAPLCSQKRRTQDLIELEAVATTYIELQLPMDHSACENFERLVDMAGTREFIPSICRVRQHLLNLKWTREGLFGLGYIVPVKHLNMTLSEQPNRRTSPQSKQAAAFESKISAEETANQTLEELRKMQMLSKIKAEKDMMKQILPGVDLSLDFIGNDLIARAHSEYL